MKPISQKTWDVVVMGGGPAGMMAAGRAGELGKNALLIEKNRTLGVKLLITGGGRCNVTNAETDVRKFLSKFKGSDKFLFSSFSRYGVKETLDFFHSKNMPTKVENELRVFPASERAQSVWGVLVENMRKNKVEVLSDSPVTGFILNEDKTEIKAVKLINGKIVKGKKFILATGGKSRPETGCTGDGFKWLAEIGHKVIDQESSLVPIAIKDRWVKMLQGITLPNVKITVIQNGKAWAKKAGKILFTHFGISGPTILNMSRDIGDLLADGEVVLSLDLLPNINIEDLNKKLQELFQKESKRKIKNVLRLFEGLPTNVAHAVIDLAKVDAEKFCHSVTKEERTALIKTLKNMTTKVSSLLGVDKAVITSGGVVLEEIDFKNMRSRLFENLYLIGDILNVDRPTGGYGLQLCWTTGYLAGTDAGQN